MLVTLIILYFIIDIVNSGWLYQYKTVTIICSVMTNNTIHRIMKRSNYSISTPAFQYLLSFYKWLR